ncbi:Uncharacterized protein Adt_15188 [Abeliophyllum distichum]|uniref:Uncharacterized protein n=1 Tax=Abeliophyllum distichum TaxID=126358 RepID=A0ABD1U1Q9_9LAMI
MPHQTKPTTSRKEKEVVEVSNVNKQALTCTPTYETYVSKEVVQRAATFAKWTLLSEREVDLESLACSIISAVVQDKGWTQLCSKLHSVYPDVVREFIANFNLQITNEEDEYGYHKYVRGVWVPFSPDVIEHFYGIKEGSEALAITNWNDVARAIYPIENPKPWP